MSPVLYKKLIETRHTFVTFSDVILIQIQIDSRVLLIIYTEGKQAAKNLGFLGFHTWINCQPM